MCFAFLYKLLSEKKSLILRNIQRDITINMHTHAFKYPLFLSDSNESFSFIDRFSENKKKYSQISNFIHIRPVGAELFHARCQAEGGGAGGTDGDRHD